MQLVLVTCRKDNVMGDTQNAAPKCRANGIPFQLGRVRVGLV